MCCELADLRSAKHYGLGDLYLEAIAENAHLNVFVSDAEGLSQMDFG